MANKYYELYISDNVDKSLLEEKLKDASFEDHFWHLACLSLYYQKENNEHLEKVCLGKLCDMNYAYTALLFFNKYKVLPEKYMQYTKPFEHAMKNDKTEERIKLYNKQGKSGNFKNYILYALSTLIVIPLMLFLVFVCKLQTNVATIICIVFLMVSQFFLNPIKMNNWKNKKTANNQVVDNKLKNYLAYYDRFALLFQNELYMDLIKAKNDQKREEIVKKIKEKNNL